MALTLLALPLAPKAEPLAPALIGEWVCSPKDGGPSFTWKVNEDLPGGWLIGEGLEQGALSSLETWSFNDDGQLMDRRQFSPRGAYIELSVSERGEAHLRSEGSATMRGGSAIPLRHRLHPTDADRSEATWEADEGTGWATVADEVCAREVG